MPRKRSVGIGAVAVVSVGLGGIIAVGNTIEVLRGTTFDGMVVDVTAGILGITGAVFAFILLVGGIGTWFLKPYGRTLSLVAAGGSLIINAVALVLLNLPLSYLLVGGMYPLILLIVFNLPTWKVTFSPVETDPDRAVGASG